MLIVDYTVVSGGLIERVFVCIKSFCIVGISFELYDSFFSQTFTKNPILSIV